MSIQNIQFTGINRYPNSTDSNLGDCQEMINVKAENGSLKIHKDKKVISADIPYTRVTVHQMGDTKNYIGFDSDGVIWFDIMTGDILMRLYESHGDHNNIFIATLNNMLVISDKNEVYNISYIASSGTYIKFIDNSVLNLSIPIEHEFKSYANSQLISDKTVSGVITYPSANNLFPPNITNKDAFDEHMSNLSSVYNKYFSDNKEMVYGYYMVGINITLYDGSETRLSNLQPFTPINAPRSKDQEFQPSIIKWYKGGDIVLTDGNGHRFNFGDVVRTHIVKLGGVNLDEFKDYIKSVNLYISKPISPIIFDEEHYSYYYSNSEYIENAERYSSEVKYLHIEDSGLEKQLLYKYKSYSISELKNVIEETIKFGVDELATNQTLEVDSGLNTRAGKIAVYNNRFHYFDTVARVNLDNATYIKNIGLIDDNELIAKTYLFLRDNSGDIILNIGETSLFFSEKLEPYYALLDYMSIVQDSRAYKIVFIYNNTYAEVNLTSSPRYNYSYAYLARVEFIEGDKYANIEDTRTYKESNTINVTAQNNPIHFPVEHSYAFNGNVKDIGYATEPISQTQIGQYPLYVFTDKGIYILEQGTGAVLYSNITLINTDQLAEKSTVCQTRNGVVYIANGSVYILSGRNNLNISLPIKGQINTDVRQCESYSLCCLNDRLYNIIDGLSQVEIERFLENATLAYSAPQDELYVSNSDYPYSYVFSFAFKTWHKVTDVYRHVSDSIMQRQIMANNPTAKTAEGKIIVTNAIIENAHQFNVRHQAVLQHNILTGKYSGRFALTIDEVQVSAIYLRYPTPLHLIVSLLCKDIPYLDEYNDGTTHTIYCSKELESGSQLEVINVSTSNAMIKEVFTDTVNVVSIPAKGIGESIMLTSAIPEGDTVGYHEQNTRNITGSDTIVSIASLLSDLINAESSMFGVSADAANNIVTLTANHAGANGNDITFASTGNMYIGTYIEPMKGGKDINLEVGIYSQLVDCAQEEESTKVVHIQSRPMTWANAYTLINRLVFNCKVQLNEKQNLSVYLFGSNDLTTWKCIGATQKTNVTIDHIRLNRAARSWKHFIVIIGGKIFSTTELSYISLELLQKNSNKLR